MTAETFTRFDAETTLRDVADRVPGWTPFEQLLALFTLGCSLPGQADLLEIGSWCGRSMVALGLAAKISGRGHVHAVDAFPERDDWYRNDDGTYSFEVRTATETIPGLTDQRVWAEPFVRDILPLYDRWGSPFRAFETFRAEFALDRVVTAYRMSAAAFVAGPGRTHRYRLAFIDGEHSDAAVRHDLDAAWSRLVPGGAVCLDDAFTCYAGVDSAIDAHVASRPDVAAATSLTRKMFAVIKR